MSGLNFTVKHIPSNMLENAITERIIKCAIAVHRELGPGRLEDVYEEALDIECKFDGLHVLRQFKVPVSNLQSCTSDLNPHIEAKPLVNINRIC
ncbi:MAG: GxxExxY protein [Anaerolineales bacterium]